MFCGWEPTLIDLHHSTYNKRINWCVSPGRSEMRGSCSRWCALDRTFCWHGLDTSVRGNAISLEQIRWATLWASTRLVTSLLAGRWFFSGDRRREAWNIHGTFASLLGTGRRWWMRGRDGTGNQTIKCLVQRVYWFYIPPRFEILHLTRGQPPPRSLLIQQILASALSKRPMEGMTRLQYWRRRRQTHQLSDEKWQGPHRSLEREFGTVSGRLSENVHAKGIFILWLVRRIYASSTHHTASLPSVFVLNNLIWFLWGVNSRRLQTHTVEQTRKKWTPKTFAQILVKRRHTSYFSCLVLCSASRATETIVRGGLFISAHAEFHGSKIHLRDLPVQQETICSCLHFHRNLPCSPLFRNIFEPTAFRRAAGLVQSWWCCSVCMSEDHWFTKGHHLTIVLHLEPRGCWSFDLFFGVKAPFKCMGGG